MSTKTFPTANAWFPATSQFYIRQPGWSSTSPTNQQVQTATIAGAYWIAQLNFGEHDPLFRAQVEALFNSLLGQSNRLALFHHGRPVPRGTMRGAPVLSANAAAGATSISITTATGNTVLTGDMLKTGAQLNQVTLDATSVSNVLVANLLVPLRVAAAAGDLVSWDHPTALFILTSNAQPIPFAPGSSPAFSVDMREVFI